MICIHCDLDFDPRDPYHSRRGKINECVECAKDDNVIRSIGVLEVTGKSDYSISIIASPTSAQSVMISRAGKNGPTHCHSALGLSSNGSTTPVDKIDRVQKMLERDSKDDKGPK